MATKRAKGTSRPVLRGNALSRIDDHGRLKLPAGFRRAIADGYGTALYVTSLRGDNMWVYPLSVWEQREERLMKLTNQHPAVARFVARVSYFGAEAELDSQGRFVVPPLLRTTARIEGDVAVLGSLDHLEVWNNALFGARLEREPWSDDDQRAIAELGI